MSEQPGRYQRSTSGMVGALLVTLLAILAFVAFRACNRTDLEVKPDHVDYLAQVGLRPAAAAPTWSTRRACRAAGTSPRVDFAPGPGPRSASRC